MASDCAKWHNMVNGGGFPQHPTVLAAKVSLY